MKLLSTLLLGSVLVLSSCGHMGRHGGGCKESTCCSKSKDCKECCKDGKECKECKSGQCEVKKKS